MASSNARQIAARCWCDPRTERKIMDPELAEVFAERIDQLVDGAEFAWGIIASANGGDWDRGGAGWKQAAERWRDEFWHPLLSEWTAADTNEPPE